MYRHAIDQPFCKENIMGNKIFIPALVAGCLLFPVAYADTVTCTATAGYWRSMGSMLDLSTQVSGISYLNALRATETFQTGVDPTNSSRAGLDATMPKRFTTGPQPWANDYSDKRLVGLAGFVSTTGSLPGFTMGSVCVPADATINSVKVRVTHAIVDPNGPQAETYGARIRVNNGSGSLFTAFDLTGANLVAGGSVPSGSTGTANEVTTSPDIDVGSTSGTPVLTSAAMVNGALVQFQARRLGGGPALHTIINEISLIVDYTGGGVPPSTINLGKLVTGGGFITSGTSSGRANFGFNARSSGTGGNAPGTGNFEYNDGTIQVKGTVDTIIVCSPSSSGGNFTFSGSYTGRDGKGPKTLSGVFSATVVDNGEPGKGVDTIALNLTPAIGSFSGFSQTTLTGGNIQYHFCDLP